MAIKVNANTVIDDSKDLYANTLYVAGSLTPIYGYTSGGTSPSPLIYTAVQKFPMSAPFTTASDIGNLFGNKSEHSGQSSANTGYSSAGPPAYSTIYGFPFTSPFVTGTDVGDMITPTTRRFCMGHSSSTDGFISGGWDPPVYQSRVEKFPFSSPFTTATDAGDLFTGRAYGAGHGSSTDGFASGGSTPTQTDLVDKFPFSGTGFTATDVGNLSATRTSIGGGISDLVNDYGYTSGGAEPAYAGIDKFPFASPFGTAPEVGTLSTPGKTNLASQSGGAYGFNSGGGPAATNVIDKFPFSSPFTTATDAGNLAIVSQYFAGHQG